MEQTPLPSIDEFEEEKFISLYESFSMSPTPKQPALPRQMTEDHGSVHEGSKQEAPLQAPKAVRQRRSSTDEDKNVNRGHWLLDENKKYHWFLQIHYKHFVNRHMRRMDKIFKTMQTFIGTRQAQQCRSHHQKMQKKYHNFITIITNLRMQHYATDDIDPILEDIQSNGLTLTEPLATIAMLNQEEAMPVVGVSQMKQRRKSSGCTIPKYEEIELDALLNPPIEEEKEPVEGNEVVEGEVVEGPQMQYHAMNMLQESNLNIGELMLYHQKEENSGLFNFHCPP